MIYNESPVGVCTIKSQDIIWSDEEECRGSICAKMIYTDIKAFKILKLN